MSGLMLSWLREGGGSGMSEGGCCLFLSVWGWDGLMDDLK